MSGRVLLVDDEKELCDLVTLGLGKRGLDIVARPSAEEALDLLLVEDFDVVVTDLHMKGMGGLALCERVVSHRRDLPVVVITAFGSLESAVGAIRAGAYDYVTKPFELDALRLTVERAIRHRELTVEVGRLRRVVAESHHFEEIIGTSAAMRQIYDLLDRVAETDASVLVTGESGTGKELVARAVHARSRRKEGPFVALNCAAMPETLLESELFAFTDAKAARNGLFVQASGGTLLLDEIGELPLGLQPKLLRALQERKVRPVGSDTEVGFDARVVTATNRDLETAVEERRFRDDLYYRINVVHVALPPLRARGSDVLLLAQHFLEHFSTVFGKPVRGMSPAVGEKLLGYGWPGNVRELGNCLERAVALTRFEELVVDDLPDKIRNYRRSELVLTTGDPTDLGSLEEVERRYILRVLDALGGNKTLAAQTLKLDRKTLYRKLKAYGVVDDDLAAH
jgi:two-component system response regulator AtoC